MRITLALSPQDSLRSFHLSEDFHVERFAAEPQVVDPVEMVVDDNGRIYVAEMIDHPDDPPPGTPERSRIRLLEDTDGDGKADIRQLLYTGLPKSNPESPITNPRLGIDNWVYCANTGPDGLIISPDHRERPPIQIRGGDFRFHPIRGVAEPASGPTQFGLTFDNWGNRFSTQNTIHLRRVAADAVSDARAADRGHFTAASSGTAYTGDVSDGPPSRGDSRAPRRFICASLRRGEKGARCQPARRAANRRRGNAFGVRRACRCAAAAAILARLQSRRQSESNRRNA